MGVLLMHIFRTPFPKNTYGRLLLWIITHIVVLYIVSDIILRFQFFCTSTRVTFFPVTTSLRTFLSLLLCSQLLLQLLITIQHHVLSFLFKSFVYYLCPSLYILIYILFIPDIYIYCVKVKIFANIYIREIHSVSYELLKLV